MSKKMIFALSFFLMVFGCGYSMDGNKAPKETPGEFEVNTTSNWGEFEDLKKKILASFIKKELDLAQTGLTMPACTRPSGVDDALLNSISRLPRDEKNLEDIIHTTQIDVEYCKKLKEMYHTFSHEKLISTLNQRKGDILNQPKNTVCAHLIAQNPDKSYKVTSDLYYQLILEGFVVQYYFEKEVGTANDSWGNAIIYKTKFIIS